MPDAFPLPASFHRASSVRRVLLALGAALVAAAGIPAMAQDADGFVVHDCPIEGQDAAVVLGHGGEFESVCLSLSTPRDPGPWTGAEAEQVTGSSRFCPRPVLALLDHEGVITVRFLQLAEGSYLAAPRSCCLGGRISVNPQDGRVRIATDGPGQDCLGGGTSASHEDIYRWDGTELRFLETRTEEAPSE